jgi:hypothetical protein
MADVNLASALAVVKSGTIDLQTAKPLSPMTEGLGKHIAEVLTPPTVATPYIITVGIRSRVPQTDHDIPRINSRRVNISRRVRDVRRRSYINVGSRSCDNISARRTGTHAHSNYYFSIRLRRSDERHRKDQTEQRSYRFL